MLSESLASQDGFLNFITAWWSSVMYSFRTEIFAQYLCEERLGCFPQSIFLYPEILVFLFLFKLKIFCLPFCFRLLKKTRRFLGCSKLPLYRFQFNSTLFWLWIFFFFPHYLSLHKLWSWVGMLFSCFELYLSFFAETVQTFLANTPRWKRIHQIVTILVEITLWTLLGHIHHLC